MDECQSHGLYRLLVCVRTLRAGVVSPDVPPLVTHPLGGFVRVDADGAYSLWAFDTERPLLVTKAKKNGIAALVINHCYQFSPPWSEVKDLAANGVAALAMLPSHSFVAPAGGTKPVFGTNSIAFAWPRPARHPYTFDFATSAVARGEIELHAAPARDSPGWNIDAAGRPTAAPVAGGGAASNHVIGSASASTYGTVQHNHCCGTIVCNLQRGQAVALSRRGKPTPACSGEQASHLGSVVT